VFFQSIVHVTFLLFHFHVSINTSRIRKSNPNKRFRFCKPSFAHFSSNLKSKKPRTFASHITQYQPAPEQGFLQVKLRPVPNKNIKKLIFILDKFIGIYSPFPAVLMLLLLFCLLPVQSQFQIFAIKIRTFVTSQSTNKTQKSISFKILLMISKPSFEPFQLNVFLLLHSTSSTKIKVPKMQNIIQPGSLKLIITINFSTSLIQFLKVMFLISKQNIFHFFGLFLTYPPNSSSIHILKPQHQRSVFFSSNNNINDRFLAIPFTSSEGLPPRCDI
jgi:hypothetical protein